MRSTRIALCKLIQFLLTMALVHWGCSFQSGLSAEAAQDPPSGTIVLRTASIVNAIPGVNTEDARMAMEMLVRNVMVRRGDQLRVALDFIMDFDQATDKLNAERYDLVALTGLDYLQLKSKVTLKPRLILSRGEKATEQLVLVTRNGETWDTLRKMETRTLNLDTGRSGENAKLWLDTALLEAGLDPSDQFFTEIRRVQKASRSILPVFFGQVTACVVPEDALKVMNELNPQIGQQVQVLARSADLVYLLLCITSWADQVMADGLVDEGLNAFDDSRGRQALTMLQLSRFYRFEPEHIAGSVDLYKRYQHAMGEKDR